MGTGGISIRGWAPGDDRHPCASFEGRSTSNLNGSDPEYG